MGPVRLVGTHLAELRACRSGGGGAVRPAERNALRPPRRRNRELWDHYAGYKEKDEENGEKFDLILAMKGMGNSEWIAAIRRFGKPSGAWW